MGASVCRIGIRLVAGSVTDLRNIQRLRGLDETCDAWLTAIMQPIILRCDSRMEWLDLFKRHVANREEVDLLKFNRDYDAEVCERIAKRRGMTFRTDTDHETAFLRKKQPASSE